MTLLPPQNIEAEQEVLGTMLSFYKPELVHIAQAAGLKRGDFHKHVHEAIYRAILVLHGRGEHVDARTVAHFLSKEQTKEKEPRSFLEYVGGNAQLDLLSMYATLNGFRERCLIVAEDGRWRRWLHALYEAIESVHDRDDSSFWLAIGRVREEVPEGAELPTLRVVDGGRAA
jgi:replicative DNA helicase